MKFWLQAILPQKIAQQKQKLTELTQQDHQENTCLQQLNQAKKNLVQAQKDLENYQRITIDYNKAGEIKYQFIPHRLDDYPAILIINKNHPFTFTINS